MAQSSIDVCCRLTPIVLAFISISSSMPSAAVMPNTFLSGTSRLGTRSDTTLQLENASSANVTLVTVTRDAKNTNFSVPATANRLLWVTSAAATDNPTSDNADSTNSELPKKWLIVGLVITTLAAIGILLVLFKSEPTHSENSECESDS